MSWNTYAIANNKYMKSYDQNKDSSYLMYLDAIIYIDRQYLKNYL